MSRYIDLEELERRIKENVPTSGGGNTPYEVDLLDWCKDECIRQGYAMPAADVAPIADTVRKMQERLKKRLDRNGWDIPVAYAQTIVDQIAKEMLEGNDDNT